MKWVGCGGGPGELRGLSPSHDDKTPHDGFPSDCADPGVEDVVGRQFRIEGERTLRQRTPDDVSGCNAGVSAQLVSVSARHRSSECGVPIRWESITWLLREAARPRAHRGRPRSY